MKRKSLPPPPADLATLRAAQAAVPLVPGTVEDCCARLQNRLDLPGRDVAATWLDFLRGLGLATEQSSGFVRSRATPDDDAIAEAFLDTVYGAEAALATLEADGPLDVAAVAERTGALAPGWERRKHGSDWPAVWRERTADLLDWLVLLGLAERTDAGYRPTHVTVDSD